MPDLLLIGNRAIEIGNGCLNWKSVSDVNHDYYFSNCPTLRDALDEVETMPSRHLTRPARGRRTIALFFLLVSDHRNGSALRVLNHGEPAHVGDITR
jgi:hypothetical protein